MENFDFNKYCLDALFSEIPEVLAVEGDLKRRLDWNLKEVGELAYLIYEDVFCYFVLNLINKTELTLEEKDIIDRCFLLIEKLMQHPDFNVRCLAEVGFIEALLANLEPIGRIEQYALPCSLKTAKSVARRIFGYNPHTWEKEE